MWAEYVINELQVQKTLVESYERTSWKKVVGLKAYIKSMLNGFKMTLQVMQEDVAILKRIVLQGTLTHVEVGLKVSLGTKIQKIWRIFYGT